MGRQITARGKFIVRRRRIPWCLLRLKTRVGDFIYYIKCKFYYKYNVVTIKSLTPTWHDRDYLLLYACFQLLEDFIEKEEPWGFENCHVGDENYKDGDCNYRAWADANEADWIVIRELYDWWKKRKNDIDYDDYKFDNEQLHKLINVRLHMWT